MTTLTIQLGKELTALIQDGKQKTTFLEQLEQIRRMFLQDTNVFPPSITLQYDEKIGSYEYALTLGGFGRIVYEAEQWDIKKEPHFVFERILFHTERFLRKWEKNAPDLLIEEKLQEQPLVIEYGEEWADVLETEEFFASLQELALEFSISFEEPPYWESDYTRCDQIVVYVYGKDHFVHNTLEKTKDSLLQEAILPILRENRLRIKHH